MGLRYGLRLIRCRYVAESFAGRLLSFPINPDGSLGEAPAEIPLEGSPDGICLDTEGGIWVALFDKDRFDRVLDGRVADTVETPGRHAIACQLGGTDGRTLFCLTIRARSKISAKRFPHKLRSQRSARLRRLRSIGTRCG